MTHKPLKILLKSEQDTANLAHRLSRHLAPGDVVLLIGEIGAGKSFFARSIIQFSQDIAEDVPSPTYTLVQTYTTRIGEIWHADLYRLGATDEIIELGLTEAFQDAICLVEWPAILGSLTPGDALTLTFKTMPDPNHRQLEMNWNGPSWDDRLAGFDQAALDGSPQNGC